jgi:tetratricopeptide (TPR) repeat protein
MLPPRGSSLYLAQQELAQRRFKNVLKVFKKSSRLKLPAHHNLSGIALSAMGRFSETVKSYRRAIRLNSNYTEARKNLARTYLLIGQQDNVLLFYDHYLNRPIFFYMKAQTLAPLSRKQEALDIRTIAAQKRFVPVVPPKRVIPQDQ